MEPSSLFILIAIVLLGISLLGGGTMVYCCHGWERGLPFLSIRDLFEALTELDKRTTQRYRDLVVGQLTSQPGFLIVPPRGNAGHHEGAFYCTPVGILFPGSPRSAIYMNPPPCLQPPLMQPLKLSLSQCLFSCVKAVGL